MNGTASTPQTNSLLTPRKIIIQIAGWLIGLALLAWVIKGALSHGAAADPDQPNGWDHIRNANPALIAALLGCTVISALLNGSAFWITIQPLRPLRWRDMQLLNLVANMLNYAPVRLGAIARIMYHMRVDRLNLLQIGAWFALISYVLFLGVGACLLATLVHDRIDVIWFLLVIGQMIFGGLAASFFATNPLIVRHGRGVHEMLANKRGLWGAIGLRLIDLGAYCGRMAAAMAILNLHLSPAQVVKLAMVAFATSLVPVGKLGFREWCVSRVAAGITIGGAAVNEGVWDQLALIESAGEALFFIPAGAVAMLWYRRRWVQGKSIAPLE